MLLLKAGKPFDSLFDNFVKRHGKVKVYVRSVFKVVDKFEYPTRN